MPLDAPLTKPPKLDSYDRGQQSQRARLLDMVRASAIIASHDRVVKKLESYSRRRAAERKLAELYEDDPLCHWFDPRLDNYIARMKHCRSLGAVGTKADGRPVVAWYSKCDCLRLCPDEARQDQSRVIKQYFDTILAAKSGTLCTFQNTKFQRTGTRSYARAGLRIYKAVFTTPNVPLGELHAAKRAAFAEFQRFRDNMPEIAGLLVIQEDPQASDGKSWNVHLNVIMLVKGYLEYGSEEDVAAGRHCARLYWPWVVKFASEADMLAATRRTLKRRGIDAATLSDETVLVAAIKECIKYPVQAVAEKAAKAAGGWVNGTWCNARGEPKGPPMTEWGHDARGEWWRAQKGFRRVRSYGILYDIERPQLADDLDQGTEWWGGLYLDDRTGTYMLTAGWLPWRARALDLLPLIPRGISPEKNTSAEGFDATAGPPPRPKITSEELVKLSAEWFFTVNTGDWDGRIKAQVDAYEQGQALDREIAELRQEAAADLRAGMAGL